MKIGVSTGYAGMATSIDEDVALARECEALGFKSLWVAEPYGTDAVAVLAHFAAVTKELLLGSSVMAMPARTPVMMAQSASTLDSVSHGRLLLGLGTSGPQVASGLHGVRLDKPIGYSREYIYIVRIALRHDKIAYDGEFFQLPLPESEGKQLKLINKPPRANVPIYLAALGPRNMELCGEIADGWLPLFVPPEQADRVMAPLSRGAERVGRSIADISVSPNVFFRIEDNAADARSILKVPLALYIGGMGSLKNNFYNKLIRSYGFESVCQEVQGYYLNGDKHEAAARIPDELVDLVCLSGTVDDVAERMHAYGSFADRLVGHPCAVFEPDRSQQIRLFAAAAKTAFPAMV